jgi:hypothetical protein
LLIFGDFNAIAEASAVMTLAKFLSTWMFKSRQ